MKSLPSRFRRLDGALADLPMEDPMLLTELDGFLTGILLSPEPIAPFEWMQGIWGPDDDAVPPFEDPLDVRWFADAVMARYAEIARDLGRGKPQPIYDIDERSGEVLWEYWVDGLAQAMDLRPDGWAALAKDDDPDAVEAMADLSLLIAVARDDSTLDSMEINALQHRVPAMLTRCLSQLHVLHVARGAALPVSAPGVEAVKVGRNDPCPCGSGRKSKRCCG